MMAAPLCAKLSQAGSALPLAKHALPSVGMGSESVLKPVTTLTKMTTRVVKMTVLGRFLGGIVQ